MLGEFFVWWSLLNDTYLLLLLLLFAFLGDWTCWTGWKAVLLPSLFLWYHLLQASKSFTQVIVYELVLHFIIQRPEIYLWHCILSEGVDEYAVSKFLCQVFTNGKHGKICSLIKESASREFDMKEEVFPMYYCCINSQKRILIEAIDLDELSANLMASWPTYIGTCYRSNYE